MHANLRKVLLAAIMMCAASSAFANVITDWDEKAVAVVVPSLSGTSPYPPQRMIAMVHAAMFDSVNSIERRYRPYLVQLPADPAASKEAAGHGQAIAIPAWTAGFAREQGVGGGLQRNQGYRRAGQCQAYCPADGSCAVLGLWPDSGLSPLRTPACDRKAVERRRQRALH